MQAWILEGAVTVNGRAVRRTSARVAAGDVLTVVLPPEVSRPAPAMPAQELALDTLYEDEHLIAVNKPPGSSSIRPTATAKARS